MKQALDKLKYNALQIQRIALSQALRSPLSAHQLAQRAIPEYFTDPFTRACFGAISGFIATGITPTPQLVNTKLQADSPDPLYYTPLDLAKESDGTGYDFSDILSLLEESHIRSTGTTSLLKAIDNLADISVDISETMATLRNVTEQAVRRTGMVSKTPSQIAKERAAEDPNADRIFTANAFWDNVYFEKGGSRRGQVEYIIAHPKHGKTQTAAHRCAMYLACGYKVAWFNLEDFADSTIDNIRANMSLNDWDQYSENLVIADELSSVDDIVEECRVLKAKRGLDVCVIDYVQNATARGFKASEERASQSYISKRITRAAKELRCYMMPLSQLRRADNDKKGWDNFPTYRSMKETSQFEQDAFVITAVFRPSQEPSLIDSGRVRWWDHKPDRPSLRPLSAIAIKCVAHRRQPLDHKVIEMRHDKGLRMPDLIHDRIAEQNANW